MAGRGGGVPRGWFLSGGGAAGVGARRRRGWGCFFSRAAPPSAGQSAALRRAAARPFGSRARRRGGPKRGRRRVRGASRAAAFCPAGRFFAVPLSFGTPFSPQPRAARQRRASRRVESAGGSLTGCLAASQNEPQTNNCLLLVSVCCASKKIAFYQPAGTHGPIRPLAGIRGGVAEPRQNQQNVTAVFCTPKPQPNRNAAQARSVNNSLSKVIERCCAARWHGSCSYTPLASSHAKKHHKNNTELTIAFTSDLHGEIAPLKHASAIYASLPEPKLLVDSGDSYVGTGYFRRAGPAGMGRVMRALGYAVLGVGNHDLELASSFRNFSATAKAPLVSTNLCGHYDAIKCSSVIEVGDLRIGFVGYCDTSALGPAEWRSSLPKASCDLK